jgi:uncharacterized protein (TIGR03437 family)
LSTSTGATYTPGGPAETITITITDPKETFFGFQLTSRIDSSPVDGQAGDFTAGTQQIVICDDGSLKTSKGCVIPGDPVQFIEHSFPFPKGTITVSWTPPATNVGTVTLYVAANAATQIAVPTGSHVYTSSLQLTPTGGGNTSPTISSGGVVSASAFSAKAGVAPGTWLEIYGGNLSTTTRSWAGSDFNGNNAPTSLDGVMSVTIGGVNAYIDFISPGQVNVQVPDGIPLGAGVPLVLTNSAGSSAPYTLQTAAVAPALLAPATAPFMVGSRQYVVAQQTDLTFTGMPSHPAKAGDVLTIYGIGFGPVTPTTGAGVIATQATSLTNKVTFLFGQTPGTILYQGLAPSNVGLYQFNVQVPTVSAGDSALTVMTGSTKVSQNLFVNIGH